MPYVDLVQTNMAYALDVFNSEDDLLFSQDPFYAQEINNIELPTFDLKDLETRRMCLDISHLVKDISNPGEYIFQLKIKYFGGNEFIDFSITIIV